MKAIKVMLAAVMFMLLAVFTALIDMGKNSWLVGASLIFAVLAIVVFLIGMFIKD